LNGSYKNDYKALHNKVGNLTERLTEEKSELDRAQESYNAVKMQLQEAELLYFDEGHSESCCVCCGKSILELELCISSGQNLYPDDGEWVCSEV
jgi:hypothetical protein